MKRKTTKRIVLVKKPINNSTVINTVHMLDSIMDAHSTEVEPIIKVEEDSFTSSSVLIDNLSAAAQVSDVMEVLKLELVAVCNKIIGIVGWNALRDWCEEILASFCSDYTDTNVDYVNPVEKESHSVENVENAQFVDSNDVQQECIVEQDGTDFVYSQDGAVVAYEDIIQYDSDPTQVPVSIQDKEDVYSQNGDVVKPCINEAVAIPIVRQNGNIFEDVIHAIPIGAQKGGDLRGNLAAAMPVVSRHSDFIESEDNSVIGMADVIVLQYGEDIETDDVDIMDDEDTYTGEEDKVCAIEPLYDEASAHHLVDVVESEDVDLSNICQTVLYADESGSARLLKGHKSERPFGCLECGKFYKKISDLNLHQKTHTGELCTVCPVCGKTFSRLESLKRHLTIHNEMKIKCELCDKTFASKEGCLRHVKSTHKIDESPFVCARCGKKCCSGYELKKHETWCRGDRPYGCSHCGKRFAAAGNLRTHEMIHTGERPYGCTQCERRFVSSSYVKVHVRQVHSNERPFKCTKCDKAFAVPQVLKLHQLVHSGVRPYTCMQCGKKLSSRSAFKGHQAMHIRASTGALPTHSRRGLKRSTREINRLNL